VRRSPFALGQVPFYLAAFRAAASREIRRGGYDAVNSHWLIPGAWAAAPAVRRRRVRHILSIHAADVFYLKRIPGGRRAAARIVREAAAVFTDSAFINAEASELAGFDVGGVAATTGVHADLFAPRLTPAAAKRELGLGDGPLVLFVGRMVEKKGIPYLLDAMRAVAAAKPAARLMLAGDGPLRRAAEDRTRVLGLDGTVSFVGPKGHDALKLYYNAADALAVPSIVDRAGDTEGMPTVILEAFASGCPVAGSRVAGIPEFVRDGVTGYLAEPKNAEDLAAAIIKTLTDGRERFTVACREAAAARDFRALAKLYAAAAFGVERL
jgi:glycosyltransferase involved in cell wall biosynthesis